MNDATTSIEEIGKAIAEYRDAKEIQGEQIVNWLQRITGHLYFISEQRADAQKRYQTIIFEKMRSKVDDVKMTVSRAENIAEIQVPELYLYRQICDAGERVCDAMRSQLSLINKQQSNDRQVDLLNAIMELVKTIKSKLE